MKLMSSSSSAAKESATPPGGAPAPAPTAAPTTKHQQNAAPRNTNTSVVSVRRPFSRMSSHWTTVIRRIRKSLAVRNNHENGSRNKDSNDSLDPGKWDGDPAPSLEEIRCWGKSFDRLMRSSAGRKLFRDFLKCEYSEENILFWLACEELKKESNPEAIEEKARFIYEDYISILSPKEVSLDSKVRETVNQNMVVPTTRTFDEAQLQIYTLMHRDSYPRFVNSPLYRKLAQLSNGDDKPDRPDPTPSASTPTKASS
ncbi:regulator of G-protein signaling rgs-2 isoform X1 [Bemisia tabaci]|uniref:regulator of G-protein signaling rgs-2 isoform X1 n=1 Tax=Bemisia tabaci TaxID=7038 RepID=UPI003B28A694